MKMNRKESLKTILSKKNGMVSQLEKELGKETVRDFEFLGYIVNGLSLSGETWRVGPSVEKLYNTFYGDVSAEEEKINRLCNSIFNFKD
jgi:hypothetical protein